MAMSIRRKKTAKIDNVIKNSFNEMGKCNNNSPENQRRKAG
jgi:hypothetical protein